MPLLVLGPPATPLPGPAHAAEYGHLVVQSIQADRTTRTGLCRRDEGQLP
ncbi:MULTISPECIES: hypothetical protein [unclassified Streptosporangium]